MPQRSRGVTKLNVSGKVLERPAIEGESPVHENVQPPAGDLEYHGAR